MVPLTPPRDGVGPAMANPNTPPRRTTKIFAFLNRYTSWRWQRGGAQLPIHAAMSAWTADSSSCATSPTFAWVKVSSSSREAPWRLPRGNRPPPRGACTSAHDTSRVRGRSRPLPGKGPPSAAKARQRTSRATVLPFCVPALKRTPIPGRKEQKSRSRTTLQ